MDNSMNSFVSWSLCEKKQNQSVLDNVANAPCQTSSIYVIFQTPLLGNMSTRSQRSRDALSHSQVFANIGLFMVILFGNFEVLDQYSPDFYRYHFAVPVELVRRQNGPDHITDCIESVGKVFSEGIGKSQQHKCE